MPPEFSFACPNQMNPHMLFLSAALSSDPPICAEAFQLVSSLCVFWLQCYMHIVFLSGGLQALHITSSLISSF
jgi:hypothetical protein